MLCAGGFCRFMQHTLFLLRLCPMEPWWHTVVGKSWLWWWPHRSLRLAQRCVYATALLSLPFWPMVKQWAEPTSPPLGLILAAKRGQGSHATFSKAEIEAVCTAYFAAHACFGGVLRPGRRLFWQQVRRRRSGLFWRCLQRRATALVEKPSNKAFKAWLKHTTQQFRKPI